MKTIFKNKLKSALAALAVAGLASTAQADDRVLWLSIGDGIGTSANLDAAIAFAEANNFNAISILARYRADLYFTPNRNTSTFTNNEPMRTSGGFDSIQYVIDRAKEKDIRVYASFSCFIVSDGGGSSFPTITGLDSNWITEIYVGGTDDGTYDPDPGFPRPMVASEGGGFWIDPGVPAARDYTKEVILDFVENYDIDGVILDRVRFPGDSFPRRTGSFGYTAAALTEYGIVDPVPNSAAFLEHRRDAVSDFVEELQDDIHALKPWVIYGATPIAFGASDLDTLSFVYQDYVEWDDRAVNTSIRPSGLGILDVIMPQFYRDDPADNDTLMNIFELNLDNTPHSPILAAFSGSVTGAELAENICDTMTRSLDGYGFFAYTDTATKIAAINSFDTGAACGNDNIISDDASGLTQFTNKTGWDSTPPGASATLTAAAQSDGTVDLSWDAATDATSYLLFRDTDSTVEPYYENLVDSTATITGTTFTDDTAASVIQPGESQTYYYSVIPVDSFNNRGTATDSSATIITPTTVIVESRDSGGTQTAAPTFTTSAAFSNTSAKSANSNLSGSGSLFTTTTGRSASFSPAITESGLYRVYYIIDGGPSNGSAIANADFTISTNLEPSDVTGDVDLAFSVQEFIDDEFLEITSSPVEVTSGVAGSAITLTLEFTANNVGASPPNRFVMDSAAFVKVGELPGGDVTAPSLDTVTSVTGTETNGTSAVFTFTFSEDVQNFDDFGTDVSVSGVTSSGGSIVAVNASTYTVTVTGISTDGTLTITTAGGTDTEDLASNALAGSPANGSILIDTAAPTTAASFLETYRVTGPINLTVNDLTDSGSDVTATLYSRINGSSWSSQGVIPASPFANTPSSSGVVDFYVAATDAAGNSKPVPTGGTTPDDSVVYSTLVNNFTFTPTAGNSSVLFPMTNTDIVVMDFTSASGISAINVQRFLGNNAPTGFDAARLIDESLSITGSFTGTVDFNWNGYDTAGNSGSEENVYRDDSGIIMTINPSDVTFGVNEVTVRNVTGFSGWYVGSASATVTEWMILDQY